MCGDKLGCDLDAATHIGKLTCIVQKIANDLAKPHMVAAHPHRCRSQSDQYFEALSVVLALAEWSEFDPRGSPRLTDS